MARRKLSDSIVEDFLRRIGSGALQPGATVPAEAALSVTYGVGRSVTREALRGLAAKGFLEVRQGSATVVAPRHRWQVLDPDFLSVNSGEQFFDQLQEAREMIEPRLAALAALRADAAVVAELKQLLQQLTDIGTRRAEHALIDIQFHDVIARASGNPVLASLHASITSLGLRTREASVDVPGAVERAVFWHGHVLAAIEARDAASAEAAMTMHLRQVRDELEQLDALAQVASIDEQPPEEIPRT